MALHTSIKSFMDQDRFKPAYQVQMDILSWFAPLEEWKRVLSAEWKKVKNNRPTFIYPPGPNVASLMNCYTVLFLSLSAKLNA